MAKKKTDETTENRALSTLQIADELRNLTDAIIEAGGEVTDEQFAALTGWKAALEVKAQNIALLFEQKAADAAFLKAVEDRAKARRKAIENACDRVREYLAAAMSTSGTKSIKADGLFSISLVDGRASVHIDDANKLPIGELADIVETIKPRTDEIKRRLEAGETVPGAHLEYGRQYVTIR